MRYHTKIYTGNSRLPQFTQTNLVNIYLISATTQRPVLSLLNQTNPTDSAGVRRAKVNDTWWGQAGAAWDGTDVNFFFYWVVTRNDVPLDGSAVSQPIFTAVREYLYGSIKCFP